VRGVSDQQPQGTFDPLDPLDLDQQLSADERSVRDSVRRFCDERIVPHVGQWFEDGVVPEIRSLIEEFGSLGLLGMHLDGYGCAGMSAVDYGLA
jgi:glutaryl-CoA dehydrogenase